MKTTKFIIAILCFFSSAVVFAQSNEPAPSFEKAHYLKQDLKEYLTKKTIYPRAEINNGIEGDVIVEISINKKGRREKVLMKSFSNPKLAESVLRAVRQVNGVFSPTKINHKPVAHSYWVVFRFRVYQDSQPNKSDFLEKIEKLKKDEKYKKALKICNKAIKGNKYNFEYFKQRSSIKKLLGDDAGAIADKNEAERLGKNILTVVDMNAVGITHTQTRVGVPPSTRQLPPSKRKRSL